MPSAIPAARAPVTAMSPAVIVGVLTLLMGIQPMTTDLYLPALPTIAAHFAVSPGAAQSTLSVLILCFGIGQLVCGPLSDRYGRKPVLLSGLTLYSAASVSSALAPTIEWLVASRAVQGLAMAAAVTGARSIIRDLYEPVDGARVMSKALTGLGTIAFMAPLIGGVLITFFDWRVAMLALTVFGIASIAGVSRYLDETARTRNPRALHLRPLAASLVHIAGNPSFRAFTLLVTASYTAVFIMLASSSFVFIGVLGTSRVAYGACVASCSVAYIIGTVVCRHLLHHRGLKPAVALAGALSLTGGAAIVVLSLAGVRSVWALLVPLWIIGVGHGIHNPCGQAAALGPFPDRAGTAAALSGFVMMASAFLAATVLRHVPMDSVYPLTLGVGLFTTLVAITAWTLVQRHGDVRGSTSVNTAAVAAKA
jgi:DHA1 family bicyclomycin/chloramphenicol resistance-like MFS transporter